MAPALLLLCNTGYRSRKRIGSASSTRITGTRADIGDLHWRGQMGHLDAIFARLGMREKRCWGHISRLPLSAFSSVPRVNWVEADCI
jgi:hypothetical protein